MSYEDIESFVVERKNACDIDEDIPTVRFELKEEANPDKIIYGTGEEVFELVFEDYKEWFGKGYVLVEVDE